MTSRQQAAAAIRMVNRWTMLAGVGASVLTAPSLVKAEADRPLRFVPFVDLSVIDPVATVATRVRNHGFLVFDTLYGVDANYRSFPILCDVSLHEFATVCPAAGSPTSLVEIAPERLATLVGARWVDVCSSNLPTG